MLSLPETMPPIQNSPNDRRNPLVPLLGLSPVDAPRDPYSRRPLRRSRGRKVAQKSAALLPARGRRGAPLFRLLGRSPRKRAPGVGGRRAAPHRRPARDEEIEAAMAPVSGFVLSAPEEPTLSVADDTIWCPEVADVLARHRPRVVVINASAARFVTGDPTTISERDVAEVCAASSRHRHRRSRGGDQLLPPIPRRPENLPRRPEPPTTGSDTGGWRKGRLLLKKYHLTLPEAARGVRGASSRRTRTPSEGRAAERAPRPLP